MHRVDGRDHDCWGCLCREALSPYMRSRCGPSSCTRPRCWDDECVQLHERYHWIDQLRWLVFPWFAAYAVLSLRYGGGREHPLEREAYHVEDGCRDGS